MVDYHDPDTIAEEFTAVVKLWHVVNGIFIWEFFTHLDYEWDVIRGRRPYRWTIWVHVIARVATLLAIVLNLIGYNITSPINCQIWIIFQVFFGYLAILASSLLIGIRVIAIWNKKQIVFVITMGLLVTDISFVVDGIARLRSTWSPETNTCAVLNFESTKLATIGVLITDVVLFLIMLIGLLRLRLASEAGGAFALGRFLWKQGLLWLLLATVAEVPSTTFIILDLNAPLTLMPQILSMVTMTIAATRMYRSLINFGSSDLSQEKPQGHLPIVSELRARPGSIQPSRVDVTVGTESQFPTSQIGGYGTYISTDYDRYKAHEVILDVDVESGHEK